MGRRSDYSSGVYKQLEEVMERLSVMEKSNQNANIKISRLNSIIESQEKELISIRETVQIQNKEINSLRLKNELLTKENKLLKDDNERMKRILNNDSSNSSLPPSSDKPGKPANLFNSRKASEKNKGAQSGYKGSKLTKKV